MAGAAAPGVGPIWVSSVQPTTARLHAEIDPKGLSSTYHFDFITKALYEANLGAGKDGFSGGSRLPLVSDTGIPGTSPTTVGPLLSGLAAATAYRYRLVAKNVDGSTTSSPGTFLTYAATAPPPPEGRGWEMVSPVDKNGGRVAAPDALSGAVLQAAPSGDAVSFSSSASFGSGGQGAPTVSQYISRRGAGSWSTENITAPLFSGSYGVAQEGAPYQLFSGDLARGLLLAGRPCRGEGGDCPVANPPLNGTDAPAGYQNYYLRESATAGLEALLGSPAVAGLDLDPADFELGLAGAAADLRHVVLSTCAALTSDAIAAPLGPGCDPSKPNLYEWSSAAGLSLVNILPAATQGVPGAALGAQSTAVSSDGSRIYWTELTTGNLYLREGLQTRQVDVAAGGGGSFQVATPNGAIALYTKAGHLWRYDAVANASVDLTPAGGVQGVLGASENASHVYYLTASGLFLFSNGTATKVADTADASNYPPTTGTSRLSADGSRLVFLSTAPLTGYDNTNLNTKAPSSQVYLYEAGPGALTCLSCNPTNGRPLGPSTIPGAVPNGQGPGATNIYKPRVLAADGRRVFFDSRDALVLADVNLDADVYQWRAPGTESCTRAGGCLSLISSGRSEDGATFVDASADGTNAFFLADDSLLGIDPGSVDLYDARIGGGFPEPVPPLPCVGDACQNLLPEPDDLTLTTLLAGPGNPAVRYREPKRIGKVRKCRRRAKSVQQRRRCASKHAGVKRDGRKR